MAKGSMRELMPTVAAIIDDYRKTMGEAYINKIIKDGINGKPVFYASENGHSVGTPIPVGWRVMDQVQGPPDADETNRERHYREARERARLVAACEPVHTSAQQTERNKP